MCVRVQLCFTKGLGAQHPQTLTARRIARELASASPSPIISSRYSGFEDGPKPQPDLGGFDMSPRHDPPAPLTLSYVRM